MPRSWSLKRILRLDSKSNVKQSEEVASGPKNDKATKENVKKKRKAPDIPTESKPKLSSTELNGSCSPTFPLPIYQTHLSTADCESLTSSSMSTDYSPSSRSFTFSSFSESVETIDKTQSLSVKSLSTKHLEMLHGSDPSGSNTKNDSEDSVVSVDKSVGTATMNGESVRNVTSEPSDCVNISDYVENAIIVSTHSGELTTSPNKSSENINNLAVSHHHPPRLTSFESSSTLHHEGLKIPAPTTEVEPALMPRYVTMDFVKSAAAEGRNRRDEDKKDNAVGSSSSSLNSSFISSVDSDNGSTIDSDVVESLYNKFTSANAQNNLKNLAVTSPTVNTGDIQKDLFPLIFPGHLQHTVNDNDKERLHVNSAKYTDVIHPLNGTTEKNADKFVDSSLSNKKISSSKSNSTPLDNSTNGLKSEEILTNGINKGGICSENIVEINYGSNERIKNAKTFPGLSSRGESNIKEAITDMDYSSCNLKEVPDDIKDYTDTLVKLVLESNTITELPLAVFQCHNLTHLSVCDNDVALLPAMLARLVNLKYLDVSKNVIEEIPDCINCCKSLEILDTSVNPIEKLTEGFTQLINLRELYMNDCFFDFLPANFGRMTRLKVLELRDNQLQHLPKSMKRLSELTRLDLGGNAFQEWPDVIPKMNSLSELWLDCNELSEVPTDIGNLNNLTYLDLSRNFLEAIPNQIGFLDQLTDLVLAENTLVTLPDTIGFLTRLSVLNLELNQLKELPVSFGKLKSLEEADISHNRLEHLPHTIGRLRNLRTLLLDENELSEIPDELGNCSELNILQLSRNHINNVPDSIGNLSKLRVLNICQNRLPYLPNSLSKLNQLEALWISPNQSKPKVQLQSEIHSKTGVRVLTNLLFPQEKDGPSRVMKLLGQPDEDDAEAYANDAADDDDLDAYARRERGRIHVIFDLEATTYSDEVTYIANDENEDDVRDITFVVPTNEIENESDEAKLTDKAVNNVQSTPATEHDETVKHIGVIIDARSTQLSELQKHKQDSSLLEINEPLEIATKHTSEILSNGKPEIEATSARSDKSSEENLTDCDFNSDNEIVISSDEESFPPTPAKGGTLRTWSSRSNLPSAITEQTDEWNPDEETSEKFTNDAIAPDDMLKESHSVTNKSVGNVNLKPHPQSEKFNDNLVSDFQTNNKMASKTILKPDSGSQDQKVQVFSANVKGKPFSNTHEISCMDGNKKEQTSSQNLTVFQNQKILSKQLNVTDGKAKEAMIQDNDRPHLSVDDVFKNVDNLMLSSNYVNEKKISSPDSGEGAPVTDHDSGVGNDVESQESVTDVQEESLNHLSGKASHSTVSVDLSTSNRWKNNGALVRRNEDGWIAIVRTDNAYDSATIVSGQTPALSKKFNIATCVSSRFTTKDRANLVPSRYVPATTLDSTTVTYSYEYHKARYADQNRSGVKNRVSDNIKKFENFSEIKPITTRNNQPEKFSVSQSIISCKSMQNKPFAASSNLNQPVPIATVLTDTVRSRTEKNLSRTDIPSKHVPTSIQDIFTSLETCAKTWDSKEFVISSEKTFIETQAQPYKLVSTEDNVSNRRISPHVRKSKFDEALAATKHKHFREKLEKMMQQQQQNDTGLMPDPHRKLVRGSTSSLASMPRITSPVPHHHSNTPFENLTADDTTQNEIGLSSSSRNGSIHTRLKEKLQLDASSNSAASATNYHKTDTFSRDRPGSEKQIGRRQTAQRSSLRVKSNAETSTIEKPKQSLEEQLGQLLLEDRNQNLDLHVPTNPHLEQARNFDADPKHTRSSRKVRPADWKYQLLQYLERKKLEAEKMNGTESLCKNFTSDYQTKSSTHRRIPDSSGHNHLQSTRFDYVTNDGRSGLYNQHASSVPEINMQKEERPNRDRLSTAQPTSHFTRSEFSSHSRSSGRRSSSRYQRTRTPGPEMTSSRLTEISVRPRSAMDVPSQHFEQVDPVMTENFEQPCDVEKQKYTPNFHANAPPSYEDHLLRRAGAATWNQQNYHDYVNVDYLMQFRASLRKKTNQPVTTPSTGYPLRSSGSHDSVLNAKHEKSHPHNDEGYIGMRSSASHDSIIENRLQAKPGHRYPPLVDQRHAHYDHDFYHQNKNRQDYHHKTKEPKHRQPSKKRYDYGVIPAPLKTAKQSASKISVRTEDHRNQPKEIHRDLAENYGYPPPFRAYPPHPSQDEYSKSSNRLSAALHHGYMEREDESVTSAFRPYHQKPSVRNHSHDRSHANDVFDDYSTHYPHQNLERPLHRTRDTTDYAPSYRHQGRNPDHSKFRDLSMFERKEQHWSGNDAGVEIVTVTVRKNPTFGFHIMGGIDAGGNPYRPDDDGVFVTYVAPGGSADQLVKPGDKILLVNGSEFVGIRHRRAVNLLRNAGHIAVLVVERLVGRPV